VTIHAIPCRNLRCGVGAPAQRALRTCISALLLVAIALGARAMAAGQIESTPAQQPTSAQVAETAPSASPQNAAPAAQSLTTPASPAAPAALTQPVPKNAKAEKSVTPCELKNAGASVADTAGLRAVSVLGVGETARTAASSAVTTTVCSHFSAVNWYDRFVTGPEVMRFSPEQKLRLALNNLMNPFNLGTIVGEAGIEIAANSHTPYGPGFKGWGKLSGTNFTQDLTGQFFGTFLIPAVTRTDPHYHRRPDMGIPRRALHCVDQIFWQRDDNGGHNLNYSQLVGPVFDIGISNLYVPGLETRFSADAERYAFGIATAPIDNLITEFVPSIASHIHTHVIFVQRVINQVAVNPP